MADQQAAAPVAEEKKNCFGCKKPMKKIKRYYRDGHYYCNKNCYKTKATAAPAKAAAEQA
jgi:hypothetical protein